MYVNGRHWNRRKLVFVGTRIWKPVQCRTCTRVYVNAALDFLYWMTRLKDAQCIGAVCGWSCTTVCTGKSCDAPTDVGRQALSADCTRRRFSSSVAKSRSTAPIMFFSLLSFAIRCVRVKLKPTCHFVARTLHEANIIHPCILLFSQIFQWLI